MANSTVGIVKGSDAHLTVMQDAFEFLESNGVPAEIRILSAHRTPELMVNYAKSAHKRGIKVIIAGAGGSAHLPGMIASLTALPVIGIPIKTTYLGGIDSLLSIVQMPPGVPVACMAINGAINAAILACQILGLSSKSIATMIMKHKNSLYATVVEKSMQLERHGPKKYKRIQKSKGENHRIS